MKKFIISICCVFMLAIFSVQTAMANKGEDNDIAKENKKVSAKCHVTLVDGSEAIIFWRIKPDKLSQLSKKVVGEKVSTQKSVARVKVYQAFQCVLEDDDFTGSKARSLDKKTPR